MSQTVNVNELFNNARAEGTLSAGSVQALTIVDLGAQIQQGLGISVDDVSASEVVLVTLMIDDSGSIKYAGNEDALRTGHNQVLEALGSSKQSSDILVHTRYLNGRVLFPYVPLAQAIKMDGNNYSADLGTPLYDQSVVVLGTVLAKAQQFAENGVPVRTVTLIVTDGADEHSRKATAGTVAKIVQDMRLMENHIIAAMGVSDGGHTDFRQVFKSMGIDDKWVLTPSSSPSEVRKAFQVFSQSAVRASQSAANFSKSALGGFGG
jgi:hypothetical protein